ncbi:cmgc dyrk dyrk2 protein kinase [Moniliophthora roreri MCA 2997]|uniref:dual-specificity kinase n=2 Tax=Moniliophthora roreri TaxID=221103 RepID=V2XCA4_MONRO|nr:cmgc dyrk dyrk2 protein kinase [Moniliophthora roreri MCA 2997]
MGSDSLLIPENTIPSRSASSSSSRIDPYYFGESPSPLDFPTTPAKEIDRAALVGVGDLTTPRYTKGSNAESPQVVDVNESTGTRDSDSPSGWTIEAIDGELSEKEDLPDVKHTLRSRPSMTEESGGEEILYPRKSKPTELLPSIPSDPSMALSSPPSSFNQAPRRARKRTSDEFELDQTGSLISKRATSVSVKDKPKDEARPSARKHRSLTASSISGLSSREAKGKERRRESLGLTLGSSTSTRHLSTSSRAPERHHSRQSSSSSNHADPHHSRRVQASDFSHLPPSPSTSSIQQFLRTTGTTTSPHTPPLSSSSSKELSHPSTNVAHSLLRGTQEGWSGMDDEATAEALRKLDGLSGKSARARASVGSFGRPGSSSRPNTPAKSTNQWEGIEGSKRRDTRDSASSVKEKEPVQKPSIGMAMLGDSGGEVQGSAVSSDELSPQVTVEKTPKKTSSSSARTSFTPKRGSASSATIASTPTTSSRDSVTMSAATSVTSVASGRPPIGNGKARRNSASSDVSTHSSDATSLKDRVAALALNGDHSADEPLVPPVPPLPKDLSNYRSPPSTAVGLNFPANTQDVSDYEHVVTSLEVPTVEHVPPSTSKSSRRQSQHISGHGSAPESTTPAAPKTPSKKWSFSSALNLKLTSSPSVSSSKSQQGYSASPRGSNFAPPLRKSTSKDQAFSPSSARSKSPWAPTQPEAMGSATSLTSLSSVGSVRTPAIPSPLHTAPLSKTPDRGAPPSRSGTDSSASTNHTFAGLSAPNAQPGPLSPTSSVRRHQSKRLTPSSIPFFRRSSSQSMQPPAVPGTSSSPPLPSDSGMLSATMRYKQTSSPNSTDFNPPSTSVPGSAHRKSSVFSLLKGSTSRKSLHSDSKEAAKDAQRAKDAEKEKARQEKEKEKEKQKKDDKDRSESRISTVLMGRKRGKTLSSTDPRKPKSPVHMPPMQISALEPATAQRVAKLKASGAPSPSSTPATTRSTSSSSRATSQTASSMQKQSDASLRSRNQLPTIAGSPSVGAHGVATTAKENKEPPPSSASNSISGLPKETPTKIPRISSRTSAVSSPPLKSSNSTITARRTSTNVNTLASSRNASPSGVSTNEFGVMEGGDSVPPSPKTMVRTTSSRISPSASSTSRVPRQVSASASTTGSILPRKSNRDSISFSGLRKPSTSSVASVSTNATAANESSTSHRFSALSPSKGLKLLSPKISLSSARSSNTASTQNLAAAGTPSSSRQSLSTPSPAPSSVDEEELAGDEEMLHYIRRQQAKKLQNGATQEELDDLLKFPEPIPPAEPLSPTAVLNSSQCQYLSEYEQKEILDFPNVYYLGQRSKKNPATLDNSTNNYGYDDDRGDYQVVNRDHLAFRYEVIDTLGKGSFGQVLHCRDHCTGESVAIKIIRNKKRFHHQALVEIKILDSLRKWDADEKHHVIKMTEHFYFRNHLCIAMELLSINLYELIKANGFVGFTTALIRRFTSQMLLSLSLMRHHRIVHCDLKPENVLLRHPAKSAIKVIDFGSSCFEHEKIYTYIQSRFYRSPEVILGMNYHMAIDMWSLGCILAELYTGFPIFPGENEQEQLSCIMEVLGVPDKEFVNRSSRKKLFFEPNGAPRAVINSKGRRRRPGTKTLAQVLRCNDEDFVDFIAKCLVWDPERRIKPQAALRHPFVTAGKRPKQPPASITKGTLSSSSLSGSRKKELTETPKKSLISAPTPLTARTTRTSGNAGPTTPSNSHSTTLPSSSRSYRSSQAHSLSSHHSNRTLNGYVATVAK